MRRIAVEEAFSIPEVWEALRDWAAKAPAGKALWYQRLLASIAVTTTAVSSG